MCIVSVIEYLAIGVCLLWPLSGMSQSSQSYDALSEFSDIQGGTTGVWGYMYEQNGMRELTWEYSPHWAGEELWHVQDGMVWTGPADLVAGFFIPAISRTNSGQALFSHPGRPADSELGYKSVLTWTAPQDFAVATVTISCQKVNGGGGNGVSVSLWNGSILLASETIPPGDFETRSLVATLEVALGDVVRFEVDSLGDSWYDQLGFNMQVECSEPVAGKAKSWGEIKSEFR
jgi:hypothetical protein